MFSERGAGGWIHGRYLCWCGSARQVDSPISVAFWFREMGPRLFQGNLGWRNYCQFGQIQIYPYKFVLVGEILSRILDGETSNMFFSCSSLFGEMIQFDEQSFWMSC